MTIIAATFVCIRVDDLEECERGVFAPVFNHEPAKPESNPVGFKSNGRADQILIVQVNDPNLRGKLKRGQRYTLSLKPEKAHAAPAREG